MIRYEFQSVLYRTETEMLAAIAGEWISAGGQNTISDQHRFFIENTDEELAAECIDGWGLDVAGDGSPSHMEFNGYSLSDLARAFGGLR